MCRSGSERPRLAGATRAGIIPSVRIDLFLNVEDRAVSRKLDSLIAMVREGFGKETKMSQQLDDLVAEVEEVKGAEASAITLIQGLHDQLVAAGTDPVKLQAVTDSLKASSGALAAAVAANPVPA